MAWYVPLRKSLRPHPDTQQRDPSNDVLVRHPVVIAGDEPKFTGVVSLKTATSFCKLRGLNPGWINVCATRYS